MTSIAAAALVSGCGSAPTKAAISNPAPTAESYSLIPATSTACGEQGQQLATYLATGSPTADDGAFGDERQTVLTYQGAARALFIRREADAYITTCDEQPPADASVVNDLREAANTEETYFTDHQTYAAAALDARYYEPSGDNEVLVAIDGAQGYCLVGSISQSPPFSLYDSQNGGLAATAFGSVTAAQSACSFADPQWVNTPPDE